MNEPLQPELWTLTLPAIRAARAAGLRYVESGRYVSRREVLKYEENAKGWSTTVLGSTTSPSSDDPINWSYMFGEKKGPLIHIGIDEVPELSKAVEQVMNRSMADAEFERRMSGFPFGDPGSEERGRFLQIGFVGFITDIISRAESTAADSDAELLASYLPFERARFADRLSGDLVVPIALTALDATKPLELATDVWIEPLDQNMQRARAVDWRSGGRVSPYVIAAATHAVVIRAVTVDNRDPYLRRRNASNDIDVTRVNLVFQCLHIASGRSVGYAQILFRAKDWADSWNEDLPAINRIGEYHRYPQRFDQGAWNDDKILVDKDVMDSLPKMFKSIEDAEENVRVAARRALNAVLRSDDEDETLDATIGLECLLGGGDKTEITHRIAQRAAAVLAAEGRDPDVIYAHVKKIYAHRSAIVHGGKDNTRAKTALIEVDGTKYSTSSVARWILRILLSNLLLAERMWTPQDLDKRILSALLPSRSDSADIA